MINDLLDWFRPPEERTFKNYMNWMKNCGDSELVKSAIKYEKEIPFILCTMDSRLMLSDVEKMRWKDIKFKLSQMGRKARIQLETLNNITEKKKPRISPNLMRYGNVLINKENY